MSREVIVIGGLASKVANLAPFKLLGSLLSDNGHPYYVNGGHLIDGAIWATTPSGQLEETAGLVASKPEAKFLIVSHSIGAIAAVETLKIFDTRTQAILISPPLPSPAVAHGHSRIQARIHSHNGQRFIPSYSFALGDKGPSNIAPTPVDVIIPDDYEADIEMYSERFSEDVRALATSSRLQLVIASRDWNTDALLAAASMPGVIHIDGAHSLQAAPDELNKTCSYIAEAWESVGL